MKDPIHISAAREIMNAGEPFDVSVWDSKGVPRSYTGVISLKSDVTSGTRNLKFIHSADRRGAPIRRIRDALIFRINGTEVYY